MGEFLERTTSNGPETNREPGFSSDFTGEAGRRKWGETNPESGFSSDSTGGAGRQKWGPGDGAQESDQNPSTMQGLIQNPHPIPGLDVSSLIKFLTVVVNIAPQVDIELKGFALDEAIFEALPGFLGGIWGNWHPAGL